MVFFRKALDIGSFMRYNDSIVDLLRIAMKNTKILWAIALAVIVIGFVIYNNYFQKGASVADSKVAALSQCLTEKGVKMYGAYWCPHCQNQKELFGASWKDITYVECSLPGGRAQTTLCSQAGIQSYPTWEFSGGKRLTGERTFQELSESSGCVY